MSLLRSAVTPSPQGTWWNAVLPGRSEPLNFTTRLPSADEGLWFYARFDLVLEVRIRASRERDRAVNAARAAILDAAREETRRHSVADQGLAETEVRRRLLEEDVITEPGIRSGSVRGVGLEVTQEDIELVRGRERCAPQGELDEEQHRLRMRRLRRLTEDVYSDPAVALRWWYDDNPGRVESLEKARDRLRLVLATDYEASGGSPAVEAAGPLVVDLLRGLDASDRESVLHRLTLLFAGFGRRDLAERLRESAPEASPE